MGIRTFLSSVYSNVKGFFEIINVQTYRYNFIIEKLDVVYQGVCIRTKVHYTPLGCYRPLKNLVSELNDKFVCRKFKPEHARMIIGIDTLEHVLDFSNEAQTKAYLYFVKSCMQYLKVNNA